MAEKLILHITKKKKNLVTRNETPLSFTNAKLAKRFVPTLPLATNLTPTVDLAIPTPLTRSPFRKTLPRPRKFCRTPTHTRTIDKRDTKDNIISWLNTALVLKTEPGTNNKTQSKSFLQHRIHLSRMSLFPLNTNRENKPTVKRNLPVLNREKSIEPKTSVTPRIFPRKFSHKSPSHVKTEGLKDPFLAGHSIFRTAKLENKMSQTGYTTCSTFIPQKHKNKYFLDENTKKAYMGIIRRMLESRLKKPLVIKDVVKIKKLGCTPTAKTPKEPIEEVKVEPKVEWERRDQGIQAGPEVDHPKAVKCRPVTILQVTGTEKMVHSRKKSFTFYKNVPVVIEKTKEDDEEEDKDISPWGYNAVEWA